MRGPKHADIVGAGKLMNMLHDGGAGRNVEADGRLVQEQKLRAVQYAPGNLDPPPMPAIQVANALVDALGHVESVQGPHHPLIGIPPGQPAKRREVAQILFHRKIEVEGRLLEHDAKRLERS
jgi:hypothetical protein